MTNPTERNVLLALLELGQADTPADLSNLALRLDEHAPPRCADVDAVLSRLEAAGLVDADRVRLTMSGLVVAASLRKRVGQKTATVIPFRGRRPAA